MSSDRVSTIGASETAPQALGAGRGVSAWLDRHSSKVFILPAVIVILAFSIFPLIGCCDRAWVTQARTVVAMYSCASSSTFQNEIVGSG